MRSSATAELYGAVRAACEALVVQTLIEDLCDTLDARAHIDASAANHIIERDGLGNVRFVEVSALWIQEHELTRNLPMRMIGGKRNPTDLMTMHLNQTGRDEHLRNLGIGYRGGRAGLTAELYNIDETILTERAGNKETHEEERKQGNVNRDYWVDADGTARRVHLKPIRNNSRLLTCMLRGVRAHGLQWAVCA